MATWHRYIENNPTLPEWPYPVRYDRENDVSTDVLVLGGGIAGCHAAINAARKGVKVAVLEKGMTKWSGKYEDRYPHYPLPGDVLFSYRER